MNTCMEKKTNEVLLQGRIVHFYQTEKATLVTLITGTGKFKNFPQVYFTKEEKEAVDVLDLQLGEVVTVQAVIQSHRRETEETRRKKYTQALHGYTLHRTMTKLEENFGVKGKVTDLSINEFCLSGKVVFIDSPVAGFIRFSIHTLRDGKNSYVTCSKAIHKGENILEQIQVGDDVVAYGNIQTSRKEISGETRHFTNVTVVDISKAV